MGLLARMLEREGRGRGSADAPGTPAAPRSTPRSDPPRRGARTDPLHASGLGLEELRATWACASWLIGYPREDLLERMGTISALAAQVPGRAGEGLARGIAAITALPLIALQEAYVDTFDTRRRGCLYLTYFSQGDTRRRGMALVRIKQDFRAAGVEVGDDELPDHLGVVLEFASAHSAERGAKILRQNRPGLELLRLHLEEIDSPWAGVLDAVCATLPPLDIEDRAAVMRLAAEGPEDELVGLDGSALDGAALEGYGAETGDPLYGGPPHSMPPMSTGCGSAVPRPVPVEILGGPPS